MKVLVTGATGFIGSHLVEALLKRDYEVTCLIRKTSSLRWLEGLDVKLTYGDCADKESLRRIMGGFDYIYHLAGVTKATKWEVYFRENSLCTNNIVSTTAEENPEIKKFVYLSSLAAFGPSPDGSLPVDDDRPHPVSDYGRSKLLGEEAALNYKDRINMVILRPPAVYGPRDRDIYFFFKLIKKGIIPLWGGEKFLSLLFVEDLVNGIISAGERAKGVYFLSDGEIYSLDSVTEMIAEALGVRAVKLRIPEFLLFIVALISEGYYKVTSRPPLLNIEKIKEAKQKYWICSNSRAAEDFGFEARVSLSEGIKRTAAWYRDNGWL